MNLCSPTFDETVGFYYRQLLSKFEAASFSRFKVIGKKAVFFILMVKPKTAKIKTIRALCFAWESSDYTYFKAHSCK